MKHAVIVAEPEKEPNKKYIEVETADGKKLFLAEQEYTDEELDLFNHEKSKWIIRRAGTRCFLADSDSGEDADGYYCGFFDLLPTNAVFEQGRLVGYYLCAGSFMYSGNGRASFDIDRWGYPGNDPFVHVSRGNKTHIILFSDTATYEWEDWALLIRDPKIAYKSHIDF